MKKGSKNIMKWNCNMKRMDLKMTEVKVSIVKYE